MAYEYEDEDYSSNVLWGRLAALLILLLVAFFLGRCSAGDAASGDELEDANATIVELSAENETLRQQLEAQAAGSGVTPRAGGGGDGGGGTAGEPTEEPAPAAGEGETYEVQPGDTLTSIAEQFYDDPQQFEPIAEANNLSADVPLQVGQELTIPPAP